MIKVGEACQYLRNLAGWTQRAAAKRLGITNVQLCNIERDHSFPSAETFDAFRKLYGVDIYIFAWCLDCDLTKLPPKIRGPAFSLMTAWKADIEKKLGVKAI